MGAISRRPDSWRDHVHMAACKLGTGGQMASLIHGELENISEHTRRANSLQRRSLEEMKTGFDQVNDAVGHLAWVQQRAHEEQLTAQYRLMRLQQGTNDQLNQANETLAKVSTQLAEVSFILRDLADTQHEHLQIVKADRTLKEVLFQLTSMLDEMILPDDELARLFLCQFALDQLDHYGLNTSHLSDLADKRAFADFVKTTRKVVRDAPAEVQADLLAFEIWYKGYKEACDTGFATYKSSPAPMFQKAKGPKWCPRQVPQKQVLATPPEPTLTGPYNPPEPSGYEPLYTQAGEEYLYSPGLLGNFRKQRSCITPHNVPTQEETDKRFHTKPETYSDYFKWGLVEAKEWEQARRYEQRLRDWAKGVLESHERAVSEWSKKRADVEAENRRIESEVYPQQLKEFEEEEQKRRAQFEQEFAEHEEKEKRRKAEWEQQRQEHLAHEKQKHDAWAADLDEYVAAIRRQGQLINTFLDEHPDVEQQLYRRVNWQQDTANIRHKAAKGTA